ncbi:MAG: hypothetical protein LBH44_06135 [Treponema sp.]|jgi:hypothetical protein|nr:hypothetical protein [Treponema sp.]
MKRTGLLMIFICFAAVHGFSSGGGENYPPPAAPDMTRWEQRFNAIEREQTRIREVQAGSDRALKEMQEMQQQMEAFEKEAEQPVPETKDIKPESAKRPDTNESWQYIPIDSKIVREHKEYLGELDYYISENIDLTIQHEQNKSNTIIRSGFLVDKEENITEEKLMISIDDTGKMIKFHDNSKDKESFEIFFSAQTALLKFIINVQEDCYTLDSVMKDGKKIDLDAHKRPQLFIKYVSTQIVEKTDDNHTLAVNNTDESSENSVENSGEELGDEVYVAEAEQEDETPDIIAEAADANDATPAVKQEKDAPPEIPVYVMLGMDRDHGYLKAEFVVEYMHRNSRPPSWFTRRDIETVVRAYINEAETEQIDHDIALAQMWHATQAFTNDELLRNRNYAALAPVKGVNGSRDWNGTFTGVDMGVRSHIQHLKGYASSEKPASEIVDPRYNILVMNNILGKGNTLPKLAEMWTQKFAEYEKSITEILKRMYKYQFDNDK